MKSDQLMKKALNPNVKTIQRAKAFDKLYDDYLNRREHLIFLQKISFTVH